MNKYSSQLMYIMACFIVIIIVILIYLHYSYSTKEYFTQVSTELKTVYGEWIYIKYPSTFFISGFAIKRGSLCAPSSFIICGSNDGVLWYEIPPASASQYNLTESAYVNNVYTNMFPKYSIQYNHYAIIITSVINCAGNWSATIAKFTIYGIDEQNTTLMFPPANTPITSGMDRRMPITLGDVSRGGVAKYSLVIANKSYEVGFSFEYTGQNGHAYNILRDEGEWYSMYNRYFPWGNYNNETNQFFNYYAAPTSSPPPSPASSPASAPTQLSLPSPAPAQHALLPPPTQPVQSPPILMQSDNIRVTDKIYGDWVYVKYPTSFHLTGYTIKSAANNKPSSFKVCGSSDALTWYEIPQASKTGIQYTNNEYTFTLSEPNATAYNYYAFIIQETIDRNGLLAVRIDKITMTGKTPPPSL